MLGASLSIGIIIIATLTFFLKERIDEENVAIAKEVLVSIENELFLATKVEAGYSRSFEIPQTLNNEDYNISVSGGDIILDYKSVELLGVAPTMTGQIVKGTNTIQNIDGKICLNIEEC